MYPINQKGKALPKFNRKTKPSNFKILYNILKCDGQFKTPYLIPFKPKDVKEEKTACAKVTLISESAKCR